MAFLPQVANPNSRKTQEPSGPRPPFTEHLHRGWWLCGLTPPTPFASTGPEVSLRGIPFLISSQHKDVKSFQSPCRKHGRAREVVRLRDRAVSKDRSFQGTGSIYKQETCSTALSGHADAFPRACLALEPLSGTPSGPIKQSRHTFTVKAQDRLLQTTSPLKPLVFTISTAGFGLYTLLNYLINTRN